MATVNINNIVEDVNFAGKRMRWPQKSDGTADFQQGDLLCYDAVLSVARAIATDADVASLVGVAEKPAYIAPFTSVGQGAPSVAKQYEKSANAVFGCLALLKGTSGDTYHDGDKVYVGADAQTITNTKGANNNVIGVIKLSSAAIGTAIAYAAGTRYPVWVFAQYPFVMG